jgi:hypothetical protein
LKISLEAGGMIRQISDVENTRVNFPIEEIDNPLPQNITWPIRVVID